MIYKLVLVVVVLVSCGLRDSNNANDDGIEQSIVFDTTQPKISSGFYLVSVDTSGKPVRKVNSIQKGDYFNGKYFGFIQDHSVTIDKVDTAYVRFRDESPKYHLKMFDVYFKFTEQGKKEFYELTKKYQELIKGTNGYDLKIGMVINNTLMQVASSPYPIDGGEITLTGTFSEKEAENLKRQIDAELNKK